MKPTLIILAAGMGSRYGGQKQITSVGPNQEILLDYAVYDAIQAGFGKVVFVITKAMEDFFNQTIRPRYQEQICIDYAFQSLEDLPNDYSIPEGRVKPWGTGHAILVTKDQIHEPFAVINADDFYGSQSFQIMADALSTANTTPDEFIMVGFQLENTLSEHGKVSRGICTTEGQCLKSIVEREKIGIIDGKVCYEESDGSVCEIDKSQPVSMNMWGFTPQTLFPILEAEFRQFLENTNTSGNLKAEFYIPSAVDHAIQQKLVSVKVLSTPEQWFGLTFPEDHLAVQQQIQDKIQNGIYPEHLNV